MITIKINDQLPASWVVKTNAVTHKTVNKPPNSQVLVNIAFLAFPGERGCVRAYYVKSLIADIPNIINNKFCIMKYGFVKRPRSTNPVRVTTAFRAIQVKCAGDFANTGFWK